ncbi:MAG: MbcA/ParS/Xre antitoxin family protein [Chitinophagaceae bacterium]|nr:MbcA/ParS/Xre antitoxin family protein [Chitinophagaceae bacterium]
MAKQYKSATAENILDFLQKPVSRAPQFLKKRPIAANDYATGEDASMVEEPVMPLQKTPAQQVALIKPMLFPQSRVAEFFMQSFEKARLAEEGIQKQSFEHFKSVTGIDYNQWAWLLDVGRNTLINKKGTETFDTTISEKLVAIAEVYTYGLEVFSDFDKLNRWLKKPNRALAGQVPFQLLRTHYGRIQVQQLLGRIEWGVYS